MELPYTKKAQQMKNTPLQMYGVKNVHYQRLREFRAKMIKKAKNEDFFQFLVLFRNEQTINEAVPGKKALWVNGLFWVIPCKICEICIIFANEVAVCEFYFLKVFGLFIKMSEQSRLYSSYSNLTRVKRNT